jgi:hypothetical protein
MPNTQAPPWTIEEFRMLLDGYGVSDGELAGRMPRRNEGGIAMVRSLVHGWHLGQDKHGWISQECLGYLESHSSELTCPYCSEHM